MLDIAALHAPADERSLPWLSPALSETHGARGLMSRFADPGFGTL
jgi:hypothetical protein